ncbi:MAG: hypothetical protein AAF479_13840 [Pseudomonadota bacterium]
MTRFRSLMVPALLVATVSVPLSAQAGFDEQDRYEQQKILKAEFERSSKAGGYSDPITALRNLLTGETRDRDVQPSITNGPAAEAVLYSADKK